MTYIVISVISVLLTVIIFVGCGKTTAEGNDNFSNGCIAGISLSQNHMDKTYCYTFFLRKEAGVVLFDAQVNFYDEPYEIIIEGLEVDKAYFEELLNLNNEHKIAQCVSSYKEESSPYQVLDETVNITTVYFEDGTDKSARSGEYTEELYRFFLDITQKHKSVSVNKN